VAAVPAGAEVSGVIAQTGLKCNSSTQSPCGTDEQEINALKHPPANRIFSMSTTREMLFNHLESLGIVTTTVSHPPVFTVEEARALRGTIPGLHIKNLFLKDRKDTLWLVVCEEDTAVDLKALPARIGSARLSFGRPELLREVLGIEPGSVTPFALINDTQCRVNVVLDARIVGAEAVNCHPLGNTATTTISSADLLTFIASTGHTPQIIEFA
jgi:Ala-tRNA(Pro) deacylase